MIRTDCQRAWKVLYKVHYQNTARKHHKNILMSEIVQREH